MKLRAYEEEEGPPLVARWALDETEYMACRFRASLAARPRSRALSAIQSTVENYEMRGDQDHIVLVAPVARATHAFISSDFIKGLLVKVVGLGRGQQRVSATVPRRGCAFPASR